MIFFKVPSAVANEQQDANSGKMLVSPNKTHILVCKDEITFSTGVQVIYDFPVITIQQNKDVYINLEIPMRNDSSSWGGAYISTNVKVNGGAWQDLGNHGYCTPIMSDKSATTGRHVESKYLGRAYLGASATADYTLQFQIRGRAYNGTTWVNRGCDVNSTVKGAKGAKIESVSDQNYMRLIVQEAG